MRRAQLVEPDGALRQDPVEEVRAGDQVEVGDRGEHRHRPDDHRDAVDDDPVPDGDRAAHEPDARAGPGTVLWGIETSTSPGGTSIARHQNSAVRPVSVAPSPRESTAARIRVRGVAGWSAARSTPWHSGTHSPRAIFAAIAARV